MRKRLLGGVAAALLVATVPTVRAGGDETVRDGRVYAVIGSDSVTLGNALVERTWSRASFQTVSLQDKRGGDVDWAAGEDFALHLGSAQIGSSAMRVVDAQAAPAPGGGLRLRLELEAPGGVLTAVREVEAYDGIAGFRAKTTVTSAAPAAVTAYRLESVGGTTGLTPTLSAFRAGADWREPGWEGPALSVGDPHAGTWRDSKTAAPGTAVAAAAQYLSLADGDGRTAFIQMERNDFPSSRAAFDGSVGSVSVDYPSDVISFGPLEENGHAESPLAGRAPAGARFRALKPGVPFALEATFTGFGRDADDEAWQFHKYLVHRMPDYEKDATFNSNGTDSNQISTGAKDDMNIAAVREAAPLARRLGISTFILDDGWQAISGDWNPDSPELPEPRAPYSSMPRFPDAAFAAVREAIAPMKLGLWMSPTFFNPASSTYKAHPEWVCTPIGHALSAYNTAEPNSSSNEAGLGAWGPDALPYVQTRIERAITEWSVTYFKFDFLAWFDCAGQGDLYDFKERFVAMLDAIQAKHPGVTLQIDETNDYRLFPFESVNRGPSWFQNGSPTPQHLLHNIWNLSPWIPAFSLGQHFLGDYRGTDMAEVDLRMAAAMLSHPTFFSDLRRYDPAVFDRASQWLAFRRAHLADFTGVVYPLLSDPLAGGWTGFQSWNADEASGALLLFRQSSPSPTVRVSAHSIPDGMTFDLVVAPSGQVVGTATSAQLQDGLDVTIEAPHGHQVLLIQPSG